MPVIKTQKFIFEGHEYIKRIYCDKDGDFSIKLPEVAINSLGYEKVYGKTLKEVLRAWDDAIKKHKDAHTTSRKVIAYDIKTNDDISFSKGMALCVWAGIYIEIKTETDNNTPYIRYENVPSIEDLSFGLRKGADRYLQRRDFKNIIDWTPVRQEFFELIYSGMAKLIEKIETIKDTEKLLSISDSKENLLELFDEPKSLPHPTKSANVVNENEGKSGS